MCLLPLMTNTVVSTQNKQTWPQFFTEVHMDIGHLEFFLFSKEGGTLQSLERHNCLPWNLYHPKRSASNSYPQQQRQTPPPDFPTFYQQYCVSILLCFSFLFTENSCLVFHFAFSGFQLFDVSFISPWNLKQPFINGGFNWMMNQIFTWKMVGHHHFHPFKTGWLWSSRTYSYSYFLWSHLGWYQISISWSSPSSSLTYTFFFSQSMELKLITPINWPKIKMDLPWVTVDGSEIRLTTWGW